MKQKWIYFVIAMLMCSTLAGCQSDSKGDAIQSVSLVRRATRNFSSVSLKTESIEEMLYDAAYTYGNVSVVSVEGEPSVVCNYNINEPKKKVADMKRKQLAEGNLEAMVQKISKKVATTPEADTLGAIALSADTLHSTSKESIKTMVILDSGVSTAGVLNFAAKNVIEMPAEQIVAKLQEIHAIPNLEGIHVIWVGLGQVCGEQESLTADYKYKLQGIWKAILEAGGAETITFDSSPLSGKECAGELPECSTVAVVKEVIGDDFEISEVMKWDGESSVTFEANEAALKDYDAAAEELSPVAEYLEANPEESIVIFGMTATVPGGGTGVALSEKRAATVKELLVQNGAGAEQIRCVGLGQVSNPLRVDDLNADGSQIEEMAQKNRAVFIIKESSNTVDMLLDTLK